MIRNNLFIPIHIILGLLLSGSTIGQELNVNVGHKVILSSTILQEDRSVLIHLPENYEDSNRLYPVLYRLDGSSEILLETIVASNRLTYSDEVSPEMIIVSIENTNRAKDMWPTNTKYYPEPNIPGAKYFLEFIEEELIPYIEDNYQTSQERIICGQSLSGVFVLYGLLTKPEIFDSYIAASGGFPACEEYFKTLYTHAFQQPDRFYGKEVFITQGLEDPLDPDGILHQQMLDFSNAVSENTGNSISYKYSIYKHEGHVPFHSLYDGLKYIYETNRNGQASQKQADALNQSNSKTLHLFNGENLDGWYTFLKNRGRDSDPKAVFMVKDGMIRISGEEWGCITTHAEYENYKLLAEFKWGDIAFEPRLDNARDCGILMHSQGEDGGSDGTWIHSIECQIIEGGTGDFIVVGDGSDQFQITTAVAPEKQGDSFVFQQDGNPETITGGRINWYDRDPEWKDTFGFRGAKDIEKIVGEWNTLECIAKDGQITIFLNGILVNRATNVKPDKGRIQIQSEGAEIFFRKIELTPLIKP